MVIPLWIIVFDRSAIQDGGKCWLGHNKKKKLYYLNVAPDTVTDIKAARLRLVDHVQRMNSNEVGNRKIKIANIKKKCWKAQHLNKHWTLY